MQLLTPSAGTPLGLGDLLQGITSSNGSVRGLEAQLSDYIEVGYCHFVNSGTTALYIILEVLKGLSDKNKVVLPAYTAPSLILPLERARLRAVLCDVSLDTFNLDIEHLEESVGKTALCVVPVHMFGIPMDIERVKDVVEDKNVFIIEDAASSFGSKIKGRMTGTFGDVGFYSFNRGKNLSTLTGGCVLTDSEDISSRIVEKISKLSELSLKSRLIMEAKTAALSIAVRPFFYTALYSIVSKFKYTELHTDFVSFKYTDFQAGVGREVLKRAEDIFARRHQNGIFLYGELEGTERTVLPRIPENSTPVFNQFPVLFEDTKTRDRIQREIFKGGVEITILYRDPIHRIHDLGYDLDNDPFPNATYISQRLLLIPTHPIISLDKLSKIVEIIKREVR